MITEEVKIEGMTCGGCVSSVKRVLGRLPLKDTKVSVGSAEVSFEEGDVTREEIVEAIEGAGFHVVGHTRSTQF